MSLGLGGGDPAGARLSGPGMLARAREARAAAAAAVDQKAAVLSSLVEQRRSLQALMARNAAARGGAEPSGTRLELPFLLVHMRPDATVEVHISDDMRDVQVGWRGMQMLRAESRPSHVFAPCAHDSREALRMSNKYNGVHHRLHRQPEKQVGVAWVLLHQQ